MKRLNLPIIYLITFIVASASILYELLIAQTISLLAANTVVWYSITIGTYLGMMGLGALVLNKIFKGKSAYKALFQVELLLSFFGGIAVLVIYSGHSFFTLFSQSSQTIIGTFIFFLWSFSMIVIIGFLTGLELPLLIKIGNQASSKKNISNRVLGMDYVGSLAGVLLFALILLPRFEVITIGFVVALVNIFAALVIVFSNVFSRKKLYLTFSLILPVFLVIGLINSSEIQQHFLKKYYYYYETGKDFKALFSSTKKFPDIERISSPYQKIDIVQEIKQEASDMIIEAYSTKYAYDPEYPRKYYLFINGDFQFYSSSEEVYHEYFAHVPIIANGQIPEKVLVMGAGDGLLSRELLKYDQIKHITLVDIDSEVIEIAKTHPVLSYINKGSLENPRMDIKVADAFHFIKNTDKTFDAIYMDFPVASDYNTARLYSYEFYSFVKDHLNDGGFIVFDSPGAEIFLVQNQEDNQTYFFGERREIYFNTLKAAGFKTIIPFSTNLEKDNPTAFEILNSLDLSTVIANYPTAETGEKSTEEIKSLLISQFLDNFTKIFRQSFIMAKKRAQNLDTNYFDPEITLYILNEKRFKTAFNPLLWETEKVDSKKVNSIMKPSLLSSFSWEPRKPY